jgi:hypothetical protein
MRSLCRNIVRLRVPQYLVSEIRAQEAFGVEVYRSTEQCGKLPLYPCEPNKTHRPGRFEFNQNIDVAIRSEILTEHRSKKGQSSDVMLLTEC